MDESFLANTGMLQKKVPTKEESQDLKEEETRKLK